MIRPLAEIDIDTAAAVHVKCWQEAYVGILPQAFLDGMHASQRIEQWRNMLTDEQVFCRLFEDEGRIVGFILSGAARENVIPHADGEVYAVNILQSHYRRGIGTALLSAARHDWLLRGGKSIGLMVIADNLRARRFYEKLGMRDVGSIQSEIAGEFYEERIYSG